MKKLIPIITLCIISNIHADDRSVTPGGIVSIPYQFSESNMKEITYKIKIEKAPEKRAYYYAMQFTINGGNGARSGYTGIQPREKGTAKATFSIWGDVDSKSSNCKSGADNQKGISCMIDIPFEFNNYYYLVVSQDKSQKNLWHGKVINKTSGKETVIGIINVKNNSTGLNSTQSGFIEYFSKIDSCTALPTTSVVFDPPVENNNKAAKLPKPYIYGKCKNETKILVTERKSEGYRIKLNSN
ncbi:DUF3472 domain-containing protein [Pseudomonas aeruginosa]|uniref:DUF3472 domain-containing protein n=1 Tax=Pseudomonas aeruginosa TaxID=287 RepID=UPI003917EE69